MQLRTSISTDVLHQSHLEQVVRELFPQTTVTSNLRKQAQITNKDGYLFEFDVWIPELQLAFEFQDSYHYMNTWYSQLTLDMIKEKDNSKRDAVNLAGMTLIWVPCWWDGAAGSLISTIHFSRPDLLYSHKEFHPIVLNPSVTFFPRVELPDIGTLMLASFPLDPNFTHSVVDNTWWMGEKYDGVRCCWNPVQRVVYSRSGREIVLQDAVTGSLPNTFIDGEFWFGRGMFSLIYLLIHRSKSEDLWPVLRFISFDLPQRSFHHLPFEKRYSILLNSIFPHHPVNIVVQRMLCSGSSQLNFLIGKIIDNGGEGMILRKVGSKYELGRNSNLIKLKTSFGDSEALVVSVSAKAVSLKLPNDLIFKVPMENVRVLSPPLSIGEIVTFSYDKLARREIPVNAEIVRRRSELKWEDVVANAVVHPQEAELLGENYTTQPYGFWTIDNMREFLENFAKKLYLDPLLPSTWSKKIPIKAIFETKGGRAILRKFKDPFTALTSLFPDIGLKRVGKFKQEHVMMVTAIKRRQFFEKYARDHGFDFLSPDAWYSQPQEQILATKGITNVIRYHKFRVSRALLDLFPDIGLEKSKFSSWSITLPRFTERPPSETNIDKIEPIIVESSPFAVSEVSKSSKWDSKENRRAFFENYARHNGFDPLEPNSWYSQSRVKILSYKGGPKVLLHHNYQLSQALLDLFPDIGLQKPKFKNAEWLDIRKSLRKSPRRDSKAPKRSAYVGLDRSKLDQRSKWNYLENRKKYFEEYAREERFDPYKASNWYKQSRSRVIAFRGISNVMFYYRNSLTRALLDCFPNIGLQASKFSWNPRSYQTPKHRKLFFKKFASNRGFDSDSASQWYSQSVDDVLSFEGAREVLSYHKNSLPSALLSLFPDIGLDQEVLSYHFPKRKLKML